MKFSAQAIVEDIKLPDYKGRHVFTAKLRLLIFVVFWIIGIFYFRTLWREAPWVPLAISLAFLLTGICYYNILKQRGLVAFFILELVADLISITIVIYLTGGVDSDFFTLYLMYCLAAGIFYNYQVALLAGVLSLFCYGTMVLGLWLGWVDSFKIIQKKPEWLNHPLLIEYGRLFLLIMFLPISVYAVRIANFFSRLKERALEERNTQLVALNRISSTIRQMTGPGQVMQQVLAGVVEGLGYEVCLLVLNDKEKEQMNFIIPRENSLIENIEKLTSFKLDEMVIPRGAYNSIFTAIRRNQIVFRQELSELIKGVSPEWPSQLARRVQDEMGFKKFVIMPLVAEEKVIGALIGISRTEFIDETRVDVFENFSNQAALAIESAQLLEEIQNKNIELERANKTKNEFLAIMSHELRTPLTAIIGFSELLMEEVLGSMKEEQKETLKEVVNNGEHLLHLINSILDLAKVEAGKMELNLELFSMEDLLQEVGASISSLVQKKQQNFSTQYPSPMPTMLGDARKVRQVLLNLLSNAIKFTPESGDITLKAEYWKTLPQDVSFSKQEALQSCEKGYFKIEVEDTGIGIDPKDLEEIFELFQQVDSSFTRKYQGTGLGLALSRQFVQMHHGVIWVESEIEKGTRFIILLPAEVKELEVSTKKAKPESLIMGAQQLMSG